MCLYKKHVVAIYIFLVAVLLRYDTGGAKGNDQAGRWNYSKVSTRLMELFPLLSRSSANWFP